MAFRDLNSEQQARVQGFQRAVGANPRLNTDIPRKPLGKSNDGYTYYPALDDQGRIILDENGNPATLLRREDTAGGRLRSLFGQGSVQRYENGDWVDVKNGDQQVQAVQQIFDQYGGRADAYIRAVEDMKRRGLYDQQQAPPQETATLGG